MTEMVVKTTRDLTKNQRTLWKYGEDAYDKQNYGYAVTMYRRVLKSAPEVLEIREKLHEAQLKAIGGRSTFFRGMWAGLVAAGVGMYNAKLAKDGRHKEAIDLGEYCMTIDPTNSSACMAVAKAASEAELFPVAKLTMEHAYKHNPKDITVIEYLAWVYQQMNEGKNCLRMYQALRNLQPNKQVWEKKVQEASALASMERGNWTEVEGGGEEADFRKVIKNSDEAALLEQEGRTHATAEGRQKLIENQITATEQQMTTENCKKLADLYSQDRQYDKAIEWYHKSMEVADVEDPSVLRSITEIEVRKLQQQLKELQEQGAPEEQIAEVEWKIHDTRRDAAQYLLKKFPNNHDVRFEFAQLLIEEEKYDEALPHFQRIQQNPRYRIQACMFVGNCFQGKGVYDLATDQYKTVINEVYHMDDNKKEAYYQLGKCYEQLDQPDDAIKCYKEIYQVDVSYRDVQDLITGNRSA